MTLEQKGALRAVIAAQVALWDAQRAYEKVIGQEIKSFEAVSEYAVCAEDVSDADLEMLVTQLPKEGGK
jgi:hypothetical protein